MNAMLFDRPWRSADAVADFHVGRRRQIKREALETLTLTERLLVQVLIELMEMRAHRDVADMADRLKAVGLTVKQAAAVLDTTPASVAVAQNRRKKRSQEIP